MNKKGKAIRTAAAIMAVILCMSSLSMLSACSGGETLNILTYGQYMEQSVLSDYKQATGVKVNIDECDTPEELYNKATNGDQSYDLICTSDYIIERMLGEGQLQKIDFTNITNRDNIGDTYWEFSKSFDPTLEYSVPHFWGTVGVIYNTKIVSEEDAKSWSMFFNEKYSGQIIMANSIRDSFLVALKHLGYSLNTTDKTQLEEAKNLLLRQKPLVRAYQVETEARDTMIAGDAAMALVYNGEAYLGIEGDEELGISGNPDLAFTIPEEGTNLWIDSWVIPTYCKNKSQAEHFLNFLCQPDVAEKNFEYIYYSTPNVALFNELDEEIQQDEDIFPPEEIVQRSEVFKYLGTEMNDYYSSLWKEIKAD